jgi:transcription antitermination factor NusG
MTLSTGRQPAKVGEASQSAAACWYALYTRARHEKQVNRLLRERGIESFLPLVERTQQWKDRKKQVAFVLFPSYIFVRSSLDQLSGALSVPGVSTVVRNNGHPVAIAAEEIANVRLFAEALAANDWQAELVHLPRAGDHVRITTGPFQGVTGIVVDRRNRCKILVGLETIGWGVQVEVDASAVEKEPA